MLSRIIGFVSRTPQCYFLAILLVGSSIKTSEERSRRAAFMKYPPHGSLNKDEGDTGRNVYPALLSYFNGLPFFSSQLSSND